MVDMYLFWNRLALFPDFARFILLEKILSLKMLVTAKAKVLLADNNEQSAIHYAGIESPFCFFPQWPFSCSPERNSNICVKAVGIWFGWSFSHTVSRLQLLFLLLRCVLFFPSLIVIVTITPTHILLQLVLNFIFIIFIVVVTSFIIH
jgi:hypothetical protein